MNTEKHICRYVITGANGYIGKRLITKLSSVDSNHIFSTSRNESAFENNNKLPNHRHMSGIDLLKAEDINRFTSEINQWADGIFHVVNCVGYFPEFMNICDISVGEATKVFECNVITLCSAASVLLPIMQSKGGGHFIAFSSHAVGQSYPLMAIFLAAKASVDSLIKSIANEYSKYGIISNTLAIATLDSPKEHALRPKADCTDWLQADQIIQFIEEMINMKSKIMNGNTIHLYNYSESYFSKSYFDRLGIITKT